MKDAERWRRIAAGHRAAVDEYIATAERLNDAAWATPRAPGKWTPSQVTEHLCLMYEAIVADLEGRQQIMLRTRGMMQKLLRWVLLPHILFHRTIPVRARAPREARPGDTVHPRAALLARLRKAVEEAEAAFEAAREDRDARITHPYFGALPLPKALDFATVHLRHHRRQIDG